MKNNKYSKIRTRNKSSQKSSWQGVSKWYEKSVGEKGHYFHQKVVIPNTLKLLNLAKGMHVLDLGCGQGVLERAMPDGVKYTGVDVASDLVEYAKNHKKHEKHAFVVHDVTQNLSELGTGFDRVAIVLALQNMKNWDGVMSNVGNMLVAGGKAVLVLNHPYFRIPKQTSWGEDEQSKQQYRKVFRYMSEMEIPITMNPGKSGTKITWSYHKTLADLIGLVGKHGMVLVGMEEWTSDKESEGKHAKMENRSRSEIPLFMALVLQKN